MYKVKNKFNNEIYRTLIESPDILNFNSRIKGKRDLIIKLNSIYYLFLDIVSNWINLYNFFVDYEYIVNNELKIDKYGEGILDKLLDYTNFKINKKEKNKIMKIKKQKS